MTSPTKRSMPVHNPPPTTWLNIKPHCQLKPIESATNKTAAPTTGNPANGTT